MIRPACPKKKRCLALPNKVSATLQSKPTNATDLSPILSKLSSAYGCVCMIGRGKSSFTEPTFPTNRRFSSPLVQVQAKPCLFLVHTPASLFSFCGFDFLFGIEWRVFGRHAQSGLLGWHTEAVLFLFRLFFLILF
eukprot:TRINITY_DN1123_c0_g2_i10.p1 TRINITY_DN1123_c0_g2~~TRINITY_DN1123_c0_g2_i10.p1  ORF type:complete len:136 (-),score=6.77 TRINITY_DN1123_c0_g2_i10:70-477(-)